MKVHHIGYLVQSIEDSCRDFQKLGYQIKSDTTFDDARKIFIRFLENITSASSEGGGYVIELIEPSEGCTLFSKAMKKFGTMPYHICYECNNIDEKISELRDAGFILIREPQIAPAIQNRRVAFMYSESTGQIELLEG